MFKHLRLLAPLAMLLAIAACSNDQFTGDESAKNNLTGPSFGIAKKGEIGDFVWFDGNCDGIQDKDELGIKSVMVILSDCQGTPIDTTVTDSDGHYWFTELPPGDYKVTFILPDGYEFAPKDQGSDDGLDSDVDPATGMTDCFSLGEDEENYTIDAGLCEEKKEEGDGGCTPGYWKTKPYDAVWGPTGYHWDDGFNDVFGCDIFADDVTLLDALWQGGGGDNKLGRHGVAALLNASHPDVGYPLDTGDVIDAVCSGDANTLAAYNEDLPCPIDAHGNVIEDGDDDDDGKKTTAGGPQDRYERFDG